MKAIVLKVISVTIGVAAFGSVSYFGVHQYQVAKQLKEKEINSVISDQQKQLDDYKNQITQLNANKTDQTPNTDQSAVKQNKTTTTKQQVIQPVPTPTVSPTIIPVVNQVCDKTKTEFTNYTNQYNKVNAMGLAIVVSYKSWPVPTNSVNDNEYTYQLMLAKKDAFINSLNEFDVEVQKLPTMSFAQDQTNALTQAYLKGSTGFRDVINTKIAALKMMVDSPLSIDVLDSSFAILKDDITQGAYDSNYLSLGNYYYNLIVPIKNKILSDNKCS